jgi:excisionase family DNA binding protein
MKIYTIAQIATELHTSHKTVTRLLETGKLKGKQLGGGDRNYWRVTQAQLDEYLSTPDEPKTDGSTALDLPQVGQRLSRIKW